MLNKLNHIEIIVGNSFQAAFFYKMALGFSEQFFPGVYLSDQVIFNKSLSQNAINLLLTSGLHHEHHISQQLIKHGDSIKDICFHVNDVEEVFTIAIQNGAKSILEPTIIENSGQHWCIAKIATFGNIIHSLVGNFNYEIKQSLNGLFNKIDHVAFCVHYGELERWVNFYIDTFKLKLCHKEDIDTDKNGMRSKALSSQNNEIKLVFTEPMFEHGNSQIQEFINYNCGPGVQHIAFETDNIVEAVSHLSKQGIQFLTVPTQYYNLRVAELPEIQDKIALFKKLNILVDKDKDGYLYQIFSLPIVTKPTLFLEIIQRDGCSGFGGNNVKALFQSIEVERTKREAI